MQRKIDPLDPIQCWQEWEDQLGQKIHPGDYVAYAAMSGQSACLVLAQVVRINRWDSRGEPIVAYKWDSTTSTRTAEPSCSFTVVKVTRRTAMQQGGNKPVTLHTPQKVIRIDWKP